MEFILEQQAEAEVRQAKTDVQIAALVAQHKSGMAAVRKLLQMGMKMLAKHEELFEKH